MAVVGVDSGSIQAVSQPKSSGLVLGRRPLGAVLHSSNEPGELSQWLCHDDSTINIGICIIIIIILLLLLLLTYLLSTVVYSMNTVILSDFGSLAIVLWKWRAVRLLLALYGVVVVSFLGTVWCTVCALSQYRSNVKSELCFVLWQPQDRYLILLAHSDEDLARLKDCTYFCHFICRIMAYLPLNFDGTLDISTEMFCWRW